MRKKNIVKIAVVAVLLIVLSLGIGIAVLQISRREDTTDRTEESQEEESSQETEQAVESEPIVEEIHYPAPDYDFTTDEIVVELPDLERDYKIAFVNDLHMITDHKSGDVTEDSMATVRERYETFSTPDEHIYAEDLWTEIVKFLNYNDFDAVIFAGDMLDYCSNSNIKALKEGFAELKYPKDKIMYLRSDHDYGGWYGGSGFTDTTGFILQSMVLDYDETEKLIEFEDFRVVGINQSYRNLSEEAYEIISKKLNAEKPVILASHVPFGSDVDASLEELSMEVRNKIYYWSPKGKTYVPEGHMKKLIDAVCAGDSNVNQIVAAHMHASWDGYVTDKLKEHIFAPAFQGNIGIIHINSVSEKQEGEKE